MGFEQNDYSDRLTEKQKFLQTVRGSSLDCQHDCTVVIGIADNKKKNHTLGSYHGTLKVLYIALDGSGPLDAVFNVNRNKEPCIILDFFLLGWIT